MITVSGSETIATDSTATEFSTEEQTETPASIKPE